MKKYNQLCVWPATVVGKDDVKDLEDFFKKEMDVRVKYKTEVLTNPDLDENGNEVPDTGGRNDLFFYVHVTHSYNIEHKDYHLIEGNPFYFQNYLNKMLENDQFPNLDQLHKVYI